MDAKSGGVPTIITQLVKVEPELALHADRDAPANNNIHFLDPQTQHPYYTWLSDHLDAPPAAALPLGGLTVNHANNNPALASTARPTTTVFGRPRMIGTPNVVSVSSPQELPPEDFSESSDGKTFPGRVQISRWGSCTVFIATNPDNTRSDPEAAFAGELFVSKLLERHLGSAYDPGTHWTSRLRERAGHTPFGEPPDSAATFTLEAVPTMTEFLSQFSIQEAKSWKRACPIYHIQVQTTAGDQKTPFILSAGNFERIRRFAMTKRNSKPNEVFILVRISDLYTGATAFFYVDPWRMYASDRMTVRPDMDSYVAAITWPDPDILFQCLGHRWPPKVVSRRKSHRQLLKGFLKDGKTELPDASSASFYRPLTGSRTIRLLELSPGDARDDLKGILRHVSLDSNPSFLAISYAWGHGSKPFTLETPDGAVGLTSSLCFGLKRLRHMAGSVLVWADAICIDQSNDKEKSRQIRLMPDIFRAAVKVPAWIGEETDNSSQAIDYLCKMATPSHPSTTADAPEDSAVWDSISKLFGRPWFHRAWVVQELVLARQVTVLCGPKSVPWEDIYAAAQLCAEKARRSTAVSGVMKEMAERTSVVLRLGNLQRSYRDDDNDDGDEGGQRGQRGILTLLHDFQYTQATLPRDKMFALLGLACDALDPEFSPDYVAPVEHIVQRYARVFVERGSAMELLYRSGSTARVPSWVPDWTTTTHRRTIAVWPAEPHGSFSACSQVGSETRLSWDDGTILVAKGYIVDVVERVGKAPFQPSAHVSYLREIWRFIGSCDPYPSGENVEDLAWRIPIGDALAPTPSAEEEPVDFRVAYHALLEHLQSGERVTDRMAEIVRARTMDKVKRLLSRPQQLMQLLWPYVQMVRDFSERLAGARACVTRRGYVGILPGEAAEGDTVVVLLGSAVPFLVRKSETHANDYIHLGECYIHGIMHGIPPVYGLDADEIRLR